MRQVDLAYFSPSYPMRPPSHARQVLGDLKIRITSSVSNLVQQY